ncbi:MAG: hypothetical protein AAF603_03925 [Pseudomonadota bacterium]
MQSTEEIDKELFKLLNSIVKEVFKNNTAKVQSFEFTTDSEGDPVIRIEVIVKRTFKPQKANALTYATREKLFELGNNSFPLFSYTLADNSLSAQ